MDRNTNSYYLECSIDKMMFLLQVCYKWYHYYLYMLAGSMIKDERDMNRKKFFYGIFRFAVCIIDSSKHSRTGNMIGLNSATL